MKPAVGFTLPWAGVTSFGFAQDRLCTRCQEKMRAEFTLSEAEGAG